MPHNQYSASIEEVTVNATKRYLAILSAHLNSANGKSFYATDLVLFGLINRNLGLLKAMPVLFQERNVHALGPLLRVQLDGLLRLHAFRIVKSIEDLAAHVIGGKKLHQFKDRNGSPLRDFHLVSSLKIELPWIDKMYETLSGWIHLSESHVFAAASLGKSENAIAIGVGSFEREIPESLFTEACTAIDVIHAATGVLLDDYFSRQSGE